MNTIITLDPNKRVGNLRLPETLTLSSSEQPIGQGMVGAVYRIEQAGVQYVIKLPYNELGVHEIQQEYELIEAIHYNFKQNRILALAPIALGITDKAQPVLVMPFYERLLRDEIQALQRAGNFIKAEQKAVEAGLAFARVMEALRATQKTCTDRKLKDFFLDDEDRVVVIDWSETGTGEEVYAAELRLFGMLWHELLLAWVGSPPFRPYDDRFWESYITQQWVTHLIENNLISLGLRLIMAKSVDPNGFTEDGLPHYRPLITALTAWQKVFSAPKPEFSKFAEILGLNPTELKAVELDWKWRASEFEKNLGKTRQQALLEVRKSSMLVPKGQEMPLTLDQAQSAFLESNSAAIQRLIQETPNEKHALKRWIKLIEVQKAGARLNNVARAEIDEHLTRLGTLLHSLPVQDTLEQLAQAEQALELAQEVLSISKQFDPNLLTPLKDEIDLRQDGIKYRQNEDLFAQHQHAHNFLIAGQAFETEFLEQVFPKSELSQFLDILTSDDPKQLRQAYRLVSSAATTPPSAWWLIEIRPYVAYANFMIRYRDPLQPIPTSQIIEAFEAYQRMDNQSLEQELRDHADAVLSRYRKAAIDKLYQTDLNTIPTLVQHLEILSKDLTDAEPEREALAAYQQMHIFRVKWHNFSRNCSEYFANLDVQDPKTWDETLQSVDKELQALLGELNKMNDRERDTLQQQLELTLDIQAFQAVLQGLTEQLQNLISQHQTEITEITERGQTVEALTVTLQAAREDFNNYLKTFETTLQQAQIEFQKQLTDAPSKMQIIKNEIFGKLERHEESRKNVEEEIFNLRGIQLDLSKQIMKHAEKFNQSADAQSDQNKELISQIDQLDQQIHQQVRELRDNQTTQHHQLKRVYVSQLELLGQQTGESALELLIVFPLTILPDIFDEALYNDWLKACHEVVKTIEKNVPLWGEDKNFENWVKKQAFESKSILGGSGKNTKLFQSLLMAIKAAQARMGQR